MILSRRTQGVLNTDLFGNNEQLNRTDYLVSLYTSRLCGFPVSVFIQERVVKKDVKGGRFFTDLKQLLKDC